MAPPTKIKGRPAAAITPAPVGTTGPPETEIQVQPLEANVWPAIEDDCTALRSFSPQELAMLDLLCKGTRSVTTLTARLAVKEPETRGMAHRLSTAGLVAGKPDGYSLTPQGRGFILGFRGWRRSAI